MTTRHDDIHCCFSCGRSEKEVPLLMLRFSSRELRVCPQCLPALIHHPERLADRLGELGAKKRGSTE